MLKLKMNYKAKTHFFVNFPFLYFSLSTPCTHCSIIHILHERLTKSNTGKNKQQNQNKTTVIYQNNQGKKRVKSKVFPLETLGYNRI